MELKVNLYNYKGLVTSVYDGDTCTVDLDLGLNLWVRNEKVRLYRINAPELRGKDRAAGLRSRDFLRSLIDQKKIYIQTIKDRREKYGRYLGEIWVELGKGNWVNINDLLVQEGHAVYAEY